MNLLINRTFKSISTVIIWVFLMAGCMTMEDMPARKADQSVQYNIHRESHLSDVIDGLDQSLLKEKLTSCMADLTELFKPTAFSIGHRGAPKFFPEHTLESYVAAARMGAGIIECDVTFTRDKELVCRHSQCDLHATTNILQTALAKTCIVPFQPAVFDTDGNLRTSATARCCTSEITLFEFKSLKGRMGIINSHAATVVDYLQDGIVDGTLLSHKESIALFQR